MDSLDEWLSSNTQYEGSLEWEHSIAKEIKKEIARRHNQPEILLSKIKLNLPVSVTEKMRVSDKTYVQKGYSPQWGCAIGKIVDKLIKANTRQLSELFDESPPEELSDCYKPKSELEAEIPTDQTSVYQ